MLLPFPKIVFHSLANHFRIFRSSEQRPGGTYPEKHEAPPFPKIGILNSPCNYRYATILRRYG